MVDICAYLGILFEHDLDVKDARTLGLERLQTSLEALGTWNQVVLQFGKSAFAAKNVARFVFLLRETCSLGVKKKLNEIELYIVLQ